MAADRAPAARRDPVDGYQGAQIVEGARVLREVASSVLRGDHAVFGLLAEEGRQRLEAFYAEQRADEERLIAESWIEVDVFGARGLVSPDDPAYVRIRRYPGGPAPAANTKNR